MLFCCKYLYIALMQSIILNTNLTIDRNFPLIAIILVYPVKLAGILLFN